MESIAAIGGGLAGLFVGLLATVVLRLRQRGWRLGFLVLLAVGCALIFGEQFLAMLTADMGRKPGVLLFLLALGLFLLALPGLRWLAVGVVLACYFLLAALFGSALIEATVGAVPLAGLLAGLLLAQAPSGQRLRQGLLVLGWLALVLAPASLALLNTLDQIGRLATERFDHPLTTVQLIAMQANARQQEWQAVAVYCLVVGGALWLVSLGTLAWLRRRLLTVVAILRLWQRHW